MRGARISARSSSPARSPSDVFSSDACANSRSGTHVAKGSGRTHTSLRNSIYGNGNAAGPLCRRTEGPLQRREADSQGAPDDAEEGVAPRAEARVRQA